MFRKAAGWCRYVDLRLDCVEGSVSMLMTMKFRRVRRVAGESKATCDVMEIMWMESSVKNN